MIRVDCKIDGWRRGGIAHPKGVTEYPDTQFSREQLEQLKGDTTLTVDQFPDGKKKDSK